MRIIIHISAALFLATTALAQEGEVLSFLDGDWNQDGTADRAYLMVFPDTGLVDLAVYFGDEASGELRLDSHMEGVGSINGLNSDLGYMRWAPPVLTSNTAVSFYLSTKNDFVNDEETLTIFWRGDDFVVSLFQRDLRDENFPQNETTCIADYRSRKGEWIAIASGERKDVPVSSGAVSLDKWDLAMIPRACTGY